MRIAISYPPFHEKGSPMLTQNRQFQWMSVGSYIYPIVPATAATLLARDGHDVLWDDAIVRRLGFDAWWRGLENAAPDLVVFETKTPVVKLHWQTIAELKQRLPETRVVLVGDHVTAEPREQFENSQVDYVLTGGSYDVGLQALVDHIGKGTAPPPGLYYRDGDDVKDTGAFELSRSRELDSLPFIDRRLTLADRYFEKWKRRDPFFYTMAGRDCPRPNCSFCSWTTIHPRFATRSPDNLLDELEMLVRDHGVREVFDDTGTFPPGNWRKKFCAGMVERGLDREILFSSNDRFDYARDFAMAERMKRAGWRKVKCGLESGNQATLDRIDKGISVADIVRGCRHFSEAGIDVQLTVMVGYPWETRDDAQRTLDLAHELMTKGYAEMLQATVVVPYPGTRLFRECLEEGSFRFDPRDYERYDMTEPVLTTPDMEPAEVMEMCQGVYRSFLRPRFILRQLARMRSVEDLDYVKRGVIAVWGHLKDFGRERVRGIRG